jgi:hypothetical protein
MIICAFQNSPSIPSFLVTKIVHIGYSQLKNDSFSFYLSIAVLLVFLYLIATYASVRQCAIIICQCPQNIIEISLSRKNVHRNMLSKMPEMKHNLCDNLFLLNLKGLSKKNKYIHQNLRYYETIEQIHFMVEKK